MSGQTANIFTNTNTLPKYVVDETLKRARTEDGSAIRVAVTSDVTDLAPITSALGTQQDPAETPTVIGLLKNLIANRGGGGGDAETYPVFKSQLCRIHKEIPADASFPYDFDLDDNLLTLAPDPDSGDYVTTTVPEWAQYILIFHQIMPGVCFIDNTSAVQWGWQGHYSLSECSDTGGAGFSVQVSNFTLTPSYNDDKWNLSIDEGRKDIFSYVSGTSTASNDTCFHAQDWLEFYVLFLNTDPLEISGGGGGGGGGGGEAISTYSLTLNNVTVTDITAPTEDPATSDDQTLVTKSYRRGLPVKLCNDLVNNQSTTVAKEATVNLESGFSITLPEWTELITMGITNSGGYMDYVTMAADVNKSYVSVTGAGTVDVYSYNASTKDFTFVSGGDSIRILSIRVEGKSTI